MIFVNNAVNNALPSTMMAVNEIAEHERCSYPNCRSRAADDANECPPHRDRRRERVKRAMKKKREAWADAGRCLVCGRDRRAGHPWGCAGCVAQSQGVAKFVNTTVNNKRDRVARAVTPRTTASNLGRMHNHGHGKHGRVSNAALDAADFSDALRLVAKAAARYEYAQGPEVQQLPRIQRDNEKAAALADVARSLRHLAVALHRNRVDVAELVASAVADGE